jgi:hypothetical protein
MDCTDVARNADHLAGDRHWNFGFNVMYGIGLLGEEQFISEEGARSKITNPSTGWREGG